MFTYKKQILENHLDTFGHVNNATYLQIYEEARWDFITQNGFGLDKVQQLQMGPVILEIGLTFKRELVNRQWIEIKSETSDIVNPLVMKLSQAMINEEGKVASSLDLTVGLMDMKKRKLIRPTKQWLKAIDSEKQYQEFLESNVAR